MTTKIDMERKEVNYSKQYISFVILFINSSTVELSCQIMDKREGINERNKLLATI